MPPAAPARLVDPLDDDTRAEVVALVEEVAVRTGHRPLDDQQWADLRHDDPHRLVALAVRRSDGVLAGWAQLSPDQGGPGPAPAGWSLGLAVRDDGDAPGLTTDVLVGAARAALATRGGGELRWWNQDPDTHRLTLAARHGLVATRTLWVMQVDLPLAVGPGAGGSEADPPTRSFVPGADEAAWLAVNNRAFAAHPEQGGWSGATLAARMAEPWFDPEGLRLLELESRLAGFCWTKVDPARPDVGEVYVIAADPWFQGRGLGRVLTRAGLRWLHEQRGLSRAELYVDESNVAAVGLYRAMGFQVARVHQAFTAVVAPERGGGTPTP